MIDLESSRKMFVFGSALVACPSCKTQYTGAALLGLEKVPERRSWQWMLCGQCGAEIHYEGVHGTATEAQGYHPISPDAAAVARSNDRAARICVASRQPGATMDDVRQMVEQHRDDDASTGSSGLRAMAEEMSGKISGNVSKISGNASEVKKAAQKMRESARLMRGLAGEPDSD